MLRQIFSMAALLCLAIFGTVFMNEESISDEEQRREQLWQQVKQAGDKSLPKSVAKTLGEIYESAVRDEEYPEAVRALAKKYFAEGQINQPAAPYIIRKLSSEIDSFPDQVRPVMKVILANWFFNYYQQNRWRFAQRSQTGKPPSEDFETWDLERLLNEIDNLFTDALAAADALKKIPITEYDGLIHRGTMSDAHRPTLFDFTAYQALAFYSLDEQIIRKQGAFDLRADSPIFASSDAFLAWQPDESDESSFLLNAVKLYQDLLRFHANDDDPTARLDADLHRYSFGNQVAVGSEKTARYRSALRRFADQHNNHSLSATALAALAGSLHGDNELVQAHKIANQGLARFPESAGGKSCFNLVNQIEASELIVKAERVWNAAGPVVEVEYRNLDKVHFRIVKYSERDDQWGNYPNQAYWPRKKRLQVMQMPAAQQWTQSLPRTDDFRRRMETVTVPRDLQSGRYLLVASIKEDFREKKNIISICEFWESDLAVISRNKSGDASVAGQVVNAISGEPVAGASVEVAAWVRDGRNSREMKLPPKQTDKQGFFLVPGKPQSNHRILVRHGSEVFGYIDQNYKYKSDRHYARGANTVFFTDRAIYRPGQTIQFKGVCISFDQGKNEYGLITNRRFDVGLYDVNNELIETRSFQSNEMGSFSGSFVAPRGRATGQMRLQVISGSTGNAYVRVEEYKRPKFFVEVEKPDKAFRLHDEVSVVGSAKAYTGAPIDGAKVVWRVVREVRYPDWWFWRCWWCPPAQGESQEIANGELTTGVDGRFTVEFEALPDLSVERESEPIFTYSIHADVTDTAGETRSDSQHVRIGFTSLQAKLECDDWQTADDAVNVSLKVSTLDGEGQQNDGVLKVFKLKAPEKVQRAQLSQSQHSIYARSNVTDQQPDPDLSKINAWPVGDVVSEQPTSTGENGQFDTELKLPAGAYRVVFETKDKSGEAVKSEVPVLVMDLDSGDFATPVPHYFQVRNRTVEVGDQFEAFWGSGYDRGRAYVELVHRGKAFRSFWTESGDTQVHIKQDVSEKFRGGFTIRLTFVRDNRAYTETQRVDVPWSNKKLQVKWEHFVSKLQPGERETWTAIVSGPNAERAAAEMVATLYDASLDAFASNSWSESFNIFYQDYLYTNISYQNALQNLQRVVYDLRPASKSVGMRYRYFKDSVPSIGYGHALYGDTALTMFNGQIGRGRSFGGGAGGIRQRFSKSRSFEIAPTGLDPDSLALASVSEARLGEPAAYTPAGQETTNVDLTNVTARKNLQETAFFFPNLLVDDDGTVRIEFEIPEALTEWKFLGFAHDKDLRTALLTDKAVTSKDLMVQPNPPRFLREGDMLEFSVKVSNQSKSRQDGKVRLSFADARDQSSMDARLGNQQLEKSFDIPAGESRSYYWKLNVPDYVGVLTYTAVGGTDSLSDGEEGMLPVLSKRILVTESLPLPIRGNQSRDFAFDRLIDSGQSETLQSQSLTVQMTSNPAWYAVLSLPYLMEYPHQCSEQVFNRMYANSLAQHIANSDPRIKQVFDQWRGTEALDSPLEKNDDIRNVLIAESPWLRDGKDDSKARRDIAILFEDNRLNAEIRRALNQLKQMQYSDGAWPWFPGGRANDYITLYVTTGFGRLRHLGVQPVDVSPAIKALDRLDNWIHERHQWILANADKDKNHLNPTICLYFYGRSFFLKDVAIDPKYRAAIDYFLDQAKRYWPALGNRQSQGHLAIGMKRFGNQTTPREIMASLTERSQTDDEMGMFWQEGNASWWWYRAPIETQALLVEAYDEVMEDQDKVEECKIWMLKQKQTQNWKTTKATADAVYALLLRGTNLLASNQLVQVSLGGMEIEPVDAEAGTGFYEQKFIRDEVKANMGQISVTKKDAGIAWGSVHWQYLEDVGEITPYEGTPLTLKKGLFIKKNTDRGPVIEPVAGPVQVGDELVTRVELRVDRDMEYVHLKDYRGSGTEPVNVLSRYKFQDGLSYYESTKDTASHFFIDYLPRGTYVFEYSVRVQHKGEYETGIAELQCMYAPEFNSHSGSVAIVVE